MKPQACVAQFYVEPGEWFELDWNDQVLDCHEGKDGNFYLTVLRRQG